MPYDAAYFGYGSLVNELTWARKYEMVPTRLAHWTREWKHCVETPGGKICALTVARDATSSVEGAFIKCNLDQLHEIDEREIGYERIKVSVEEVASSASALPTHLFIYKSLPQHYRSGTPNYPLWFSYLEVVVYGYWRVFGEAGIDRFIASTTGWDTPILDDRDAPRYPRFHQLGVDDRKLIEKKSRAYWGKGLFLRKHCSHADERFPGWSRGRIQGVVRLDPALQQRTLSSFAAVFYDQRRLDIWHSAARLAEIWKCRRFRCCSGSHSLRDILYLGNHAEFIH
jgi:glutathione-specific gamma-glutamylcyclotransferase